MVIDKKINPDRLTDELQAIPELSPVNKEAKFVVSASLNSAEIFFFDELGEDVLLRIQEIVDAHEPDTATSSSRRKWDELARGFNESRLNQQVITPIKHATDPIPQQGAIWSAAEQIEKAIVMTYYSDDDRIRGLTGHLQFLFDQFRVAEIDVPADICRELASLCNAAGFPEVAAIVPNATPKEDTTST
jgi:hypothetical protein